MPDSSLWFCFLLSHDVAASVYTCVLGFCTEMCYFKIKIAILTKMIVMCFPNILSVNPRYTSKLHNTYECGKW